MPAPVGRRRENKAIPPGAVSWSHETWVKVIGPLPPSEHKVQKKIRHQNLKKKTSAFLRRGKKSGCPKIPNSRMLISFLLAPSVFWIAVTQSTSATICRSILSIPGPKSPRAPSRLARKTWGFLHQIFTQGSYGKEIGSEYFLGKCHLAFLGEV